jgi:ubiquinone/menaquinone biosynthesis C-methylase UbiE
MVTTGGRHELAPDAHGRVAERLIAEGLTPVLEVGCGEGELARHLPAGAWVGVDSSPAKLARAPEPKQLAKVGALPFPDASFGGVTLLDVLHDVLLPELAVAEAHRVLRPGGLVAVTLDAERAPKLLGEHFAEVEVATERGAIAFGRKGG